MKQYRVAILGASGAVGQEMMKILAERKFPVGELHLLASARSAGKVVSWQGRDIVVEEATDAAFSGTSEKYVSASGRESASSIAVPRSTPSAVNIPSVSPSVSSSPSTTQLSPGTASAAVVSSSKARIQEMIFFKKRFTSRK